MPKNVPPSLQESLTSQFGSLVGKTLVAVKPANNEQCDALGIEQGYGCPAVAFCFNDGQVLVPLQDPEGNGPGFAEILKPA